VRHASPLAGSVADVRVWIDQDLCTGDGLCVDHCHDVFTLLEDGIAYVVQDGAPMNDPGGSGSLAMVEPRYEQSVIDAALACPGECIFIEVGRVYDVPSSLVGDPAGGSATPSSRPVDDDDDEAAA
jgi:ferredoxin